MMNIVICPDCKKEGVAEKHYCDCKCKYCSGKCGEYAYRCQYCQSLNVDCLVRI